MQRGPGRRLPESAVLKQDYDRLGSLQAVGDLYGVSRERIRQLIEEQYPGHIRASARTRSQTRVQEIERARERWQATAPIRKCKICGSSFRSRKGVTCSPVCSRVWRVARPLLDDKTYLRLRRSLALSVLKHPEGKARHQIEFAQRVVAGQSSVERWVHETSVSYKALEGVLGPAGARRLLERRGIVILP